LSASRHTFAVVATLAGLTVASVPLGQSVASAAAAPASGCADIEVLVSRGTSEPGTIGSLSVVANAITKGTNKTVATFGNPYPASFSFASSTPVGVTDLSQELTKQSSACPNQKFVLLGYSQGAIVAGDVLGGGSFTRSAPIGAAIGNKIIATVMWGDPRFNNVEPFNGGTFTKGVNGTFARPTGQLKAFNGRILDFCLAADGVCQGNGALRINAGHLSYPRDNAAIKASADFAIAKINGTTTAAAPAAAPTTTKTTPRRHWWSSLFS
jgi:hypothetical protein